MVLAPGYVAELINLRASLIVVFLLPVAFAGELNVDMVDSEQLVQRARTYVEALDGGCTYGDGYVCAGDDEIGGTTSVTGPYLDAWKVCHEDFLAIEDLNAQQKDLRHYRVEFAENEAMFVISLNGLLLPYMGDSGKPEGVIQAVYGRTTRYWVDKATLGITKRLFYK